MKEVITTILCIGIVALVVGLGIWQFLTNPSPAPAPIEHRECLEMSRDGSYCFRQAL